MASTLTLACNSRETPPTRVNVNTAVAPSVTGSGAVTDTTGSSSVTVTCADEALPRT